MTCQVGLGRPPEHVQIKSLERHYNTHSLGVSHMQCATLLGLAHLLDERLGFVYWLVLLYSLVGILLPGRSSISDVVLDL